MCFFSRPLSAVNLHLALQIPTYTVFCWKWGIEPTNWHATIRHQLAYNNRRCCSPLGLATQRAAIHQIHLYELPPSATVSKTPPHLIAVSILDFCGSGRIRTCCVSNVPDLQSGAHPPSEQHSLKNTYTYPWTGLCYPEYTFITQRPYWFNLCNTHTYPLVFFVVRGRIELPTQGFSVLCSTKLSYRTIL